MAQKKLPEKVTKKVVRYIRTLEKDNVPIVSVYVFGSFAKGTQHKWSDIDVCVVSTNFEDAWDSARYLWGKRSDDIYLTIEPVGFTPQDFEEESFPLVHEIKKHGIKIKT